MDKNEYRIKVGKINKLIELRDYTSALEIAETVDWTRVKNARMLCLASEIYRKNGQYEEAREFLLQAYEYSPSSRRIVYRLSELSVKLGEIDEAIDYFQEFVQLAPNDTDRFILKYRIYQARGSAIEDQIKILEDYKRHEYDEKWVFELARLYASAGMTQKCVDECDELILWFSEGEFVTKAMELKKLFKPLTPLQQEKYEAAMATKNAPVPAQEPVPVREEAEKEEAPKEEPVKPAVPRRTAATGRQDEREDLEEEREDVPVRKFQILRSKKKEADEEAPVSAIDEPGMELPDLAAEVQRMKAQADAPIEEQPVEAAPEPEDGALAEETDTEHGLQDGSQENSEIQSYQEEEPDGLPSDPFRPLPRRSRVEMAASKKRTKKKIDLEPDYELNEPVVHHAFDPFKSADSAKLDEEALEEELANNLKEIMGERFEKASEDIVLQAHAAIKESKEKIDQMLNEDYQVQIPDDVKSLLEKYEPDQEEVLQRQEADDIEDLENEWEEAVDSAEEESDQAEESALTEDNDDAANDLEEKIEDSIPDDIEALVETEARAQLEMTQVREPLALKPLPKEYHDIFNYFIPVRGMRQQLETVLENERNCKKRNGTSITGNILITGEHGTGKTVLAIDVVKAIYQVKNKKDAKVGKITAKTLNNKKVADVMKKIRGGALVIEQAGSMSEKTVNDLDRWMCSLTEESLIVLEDSKEELYQCLVKNPVFAGKFISTIEIPVFNNDELIEFAKHYANEIGYSIEEMGILALYNEIGNRQTDDHNVTVAEVKELVDRATDREAKFSIGKFLAGNKRYDDDKRVILKEKHFEEDS